MTGANDPPPTGAREAVGATVTGAWLVGVRDGEEVTGASVVGATATGANVLPSAGESEPVGARFTRTNVVGTTVSTSSSPEPLPESDLLSEPSRRSRNRAWNRLY